MKNSKEKIKRFMLFCSLSLSLFIAYGMPVMAKGLGENFATTVLDELFWFAIVVVIFCVFKLFVKNNYVVLILTLVAGVIVLFIIKNPTALSNLSEYFGSKIFEV